MTSTLTARGYVAAVLVAIAVLAVVLLAMHTIGAPIHGPIFSASDATGTVKWKP